ncbi:PREDICTED: kinesin-like protein KIN-12F isoform X2 [Lupinus angustifolius]|uniref:kinesin-like protein KIN-12F isoform X2 n=1 Tax=Lupinus angustifolius TaxID=3871 RepID=UPI00092FB554|nr:PREDICTED: kinesin-like protein KIN-12F isoform X2 [Lupinus angustifolius]
MRKSNNTESSFLGSISSSSIRNLLPKSFSSKLNSSKSVSENTPPVHSNILINHHYQPHPKTSISHSYDVTKSESLHDPPVKVVVRISSENSNIREGDCEIKKVSSDTLCVGDMQLTFDEVFDTNSSQEDIFQSVGVPLVRNALAGYNTSLLSYGQSGSGKTYTMWGPLNAMVVDPSHHSHPGIASRIFQMLFSELEREECISDRNYQCRCSFIEVYNEQIGDLLNPIKQNLEMKDDSKNALRIDNLIEEDVTSYDDMAKLLMKGLSSRKVGAMRSTSNSLRSHIIFTFTIESWCKGTTKNFNSSNSKTSRINLIDLAGLDKHNINDACSQYLGERRNVNNSSFQLGHLVDALTKEYKSGNEDTPHRNSCLTCLLQESLGGNAKLSVICSIFPDNKSNGETLHMLRIGQRVRSIRNGPVINEIKEAEVDFGDTIQLLKEELIRAKAGVHSSVGNKCFQHNVQERLNQYRVSLNHSLILPHMDNATYDEVNEDDIRQLREQIDELHSSSEGNLKDIPVREDRIQFCSVEENCDADMTNDDENAEVCYGQTLSKPCHEDIVASEDNKYRAKISMATKFPLRDSISVSSFSKSPILDGPQLSESPKFSNSQKKGTSISSSYLGSWNNVAESSNFSKELLGKSVKQDEHIKSSLQSSKAECLAVSLQRGLQMINYHQSNSALSKSSSSFSFEHLSLTQCSEIDKFECSDQTIQQKPSSDKITPTLLCASCQTKISDQDTTEVQDILKSWTEADGKAGNPDGLADKAPKHLESVLAKGIMREKELENVIKEQATRIEQLNQLVVEKFKGENELNSIVGYGQHDDYNSMKDKDKFLRSTSTYGHLPCIIEEKCEIEEVHEELALRDSSLDATEKESLLKEIHNLRSKLQLYSDAPVKKSTDRFGSLMSRSIQLQKSGVFSHNIGVEELENERHRWTEMESEWICLTDELRADLEFYRQRAERLEMELRSEKKCTAELDDALSRAVIGHSRMVEHYADLQEKYNDLVAKHAAMMEGIAEVKKAVTNASKKGCARFAKSLAAELSALRVERERESQLLKKENQILKSQLRDTAEAVQAAGELLVRLREAEHATSVAEENFANMQQDNEDLRMQVEKLKRKHKTEISTMNQYLTESKLPQSALQPQYREDSLVVDESATSYMYDDQAWRAEFGAIYQEHY